MCNNVASLVQFNVKSGDVHGVDVADVLHQLATLSPVDVSRV